MPTKYYQFQVYLDSCLNKQEYNSLIQYFETDFTYDYLWKVFTYDYLWKVNLKILNSGIVLKLSPKLFLWSCPIN